jgi:hypothetical protein
MSSVLHFKPEFGNRQHIRIVKDYDQRMSGVRPVIYRQAPASCTPVQLDDLDGTWVFHRYPGKKLLYTHSLITCPRCLRDSEVCFHNHNTASLDTSDWQYCDFCGLNFELKEGEVYVVQEGAEA